MSKQYKIVGADGHMYSINSAGSMRSHAVDNELHIDGQMRMYEPRINDEDSSSPKFRI